MNKYKSLGIYKKNNCRWTFIKSVDTLNSIRCPFCLKKGIFLPAGKLETYTCKNCFLNHRFNSKFIILEKLDET